MKKPLNVLVVEDSEFDAVMLINVLRTNGYQPFYKRVDTSEAMKEAMAGHAWDVVLSDYNMPQFSMSEALEVLHESGQDLPFIIVSGGIGEDIAVNAMKAGAHDYLMKGSLARLAPAVERELREASIRAAQRKSEEALRESELRYRLLWETSTDAVMIIDADTIIHFANPAVRTVFGYEPEELVGKSVQLLQPPDVQEKTQEGVARYLSSGEQPVKQTAHETVGLHKSGRHVPIEIAYSEMLLHQKRWLVTFIRDITERKKTEQELRDNEEQFRVAREIQQRLFPKAPPAYPQFDVFGTSFPAQATGGDYYDYLTMVDGTMGVAVGDVSGHGIGPALLMSEARAYLRILSRNRYDLGDILSRANRMLAEDVSYERFITLILAKFDQSNLTLTYASAGHPPGYVISASGNVKNRLKRTGCPLGLQPDAVYTAAATITLEPGDVVLLLTDGVEEALSPEEEFFGVDRILASVKANLDKTANEIAMALFKDVRAFSRQAEQLDDITSVVIKVLG